jgi:hypothetical protein
LISVRGMRVSLVNVFSMSSINRVLRDETPTDTRL